MVSSMLGHPNPRRERVHYQGVLRFEMEVKEPTTKGDREVENEANDFTEEIEDDPENLKMRSTSAKTPEEVEDELRTSVILGTRNYERHSANAAILRNDIDCLCYQERYRISHQTGLLDDCGSAQAGKFDLVKVVAEEVVEHAELEGLVLSQRKRKVFSVLAGGPGPIVEWMGRRYVLRAIRLMFDDYATEPFARLLALAWLNKKGHSAVVNGLILLSLQNLAIRFEDVLDRLEVLAAVRILKLGCWVLCDTIELSSAALSSKDFRW
ncbi:hypothetical protein EV361DRAFT_871801 [Lentinula raphanica]|nr:hypothetical protein EV361DRAFT_871801 [Lentinula raphanica]